MHSFSQIALGAVASVAVMGRRSAVFALREEAGRVLISDLRMGQESHYAFTFAAADKRSAAVPLAAPELVGSRGEVACLLSWLGPRMAGSPLPPPERACAKSS